MADIWTRQKRSEVMGLIRSRGNRRTEMRLIEAFRSEGIKGWRRHLPLPGKPDFAFRAERLLVFVDGCFWHGCARCYRRPASNRTYWDAKVIRNKTRDREVTRELKKRGWRVLRVWEHDLKAMPRLIRRVRKALAA
jgi:DNA mismatch endonuclease (patch repair protein)